MISSPDLVINGWPLGIRSQGIGAYTVRIIFGLLKCAPSIRFRVLVPRTFASLVTDLPAEIIHWVEGAPPITRSVALEIYWNICIGRAARRSFPEAIFHCPREFWGPWYPRRTVVTLHDCYHWFFPRTQGGSIRRWWRRITERFARTQASLVLTVSEWSRKDLLESLLIPAARTKVVYPWLDTEALSATARDTRERVGKKLGLPERFFIYIGGFSDNKNVEFLIRAYALAASRNPLPPLVIAGNIPHHHRVATCDVLGTILAAGLKPTQVLLPGYIQEDDLPGLLSGAELLIYPSLYEGFGYPPVEAMAVGTPVLVANATSLRETVSREGCRFDPTNLEELSGKLLSATQSPKQFLCPLDPVFGVDAGIARYLSTLGELRQFAIPGTTPLTRLPSLHE